jgi:hypothetical protein
MPGNNGHPEKSMEHKGFFNFAEKSRALSVFEKNYMLRRLGK